MSALAVEKEVNPHFDDFLFDWSTNGSKIIFKGMDKPRKLKSIRIFQKNRWEIWTDSAEQKAISYYNKKAFE